MKGIQLAFLRKFVFVFVFVFAMIASSLICTPSLAADGQYPQLKSLVSQKKYQEAYDLGNTLFDKGAGDPNFDMLYGEAALNSGHYSEAAFAYQRVLILQPNNHYAHLQIALARYHQDQLGEAKAEADLVLAKQPPPEVRKNIEEFLAAIEQKRLRVTDVPADAKLMQVRMNFTIGHDSNINSSSEDPTITDLIIPPDISIRGNDVASASAFGLEIPSEFARYGLVIDGFIPIKKYEQNRYLTYYTNLFLSYTDFIKDHPFDDEPPFDLGNYFWDNGLLYRTENEIYKFPFRMQFLRLQDRALLNTFSLAPEYLRRLNAKHTIGGSVSVAALRYPNVDTLNQTQVFGAFIWQYTNPKANFYSDIKLILGDSEATKDRNDYNGRTFVGFNIYGQWVFRQNQMFFVNYAGRFSNFDARDPAFDDKRDEQFRQLTVGWNWILRENLMFKPFYSYAKNNSTVDVYEFDRQEIGVGLEYYFDSIQAKKWLAEKRARLDAEAALATEDQGLHAGGAL